EYPDSKKRDLVWGIFERISKLTEADALKSGAMKGPYDKIPFFRFDDEAAAEFLAWREDLERRLRGDSLSPALEGHMAKYRKLDAYRPSRRGRKRRRRERGAAARAGDGRIP